MLNLDPVSPITCYVTTAAYLANDRIDDAINEGQRTLLLDPNYCYLDSNLAAAYRDKGNFAEAIALYTKSQEATHLPSSGLAITYARMGRQMEAQDILAQLLQAREKLSENILRFHLPAHARVGDGKTATGEMRRLLRFGVERDRFSEVALIAIGGSKIRIQVEVIRIEQERPLALINSIVDAVVSQIGSGSNVAGDRRHGV